ncbi:MAG: gamma-glutamyl-gamma-aminobutyrate hydrolase family protein [Nitrospirae bacterium]|nr:gamma-glutamyl-gamma-aminobutyrate hydrolase family protein [Nitrospirota bacterium]
MKPIIGITSDIDGDLFKLRQDYVFAVEKSGGLPLIIPPHPPLLKGGRGGLMDNIPQIADMIDGLLIPGGNDLLPEYYGEEISAPLETLKFVKKERSDFELALLKEVIKRNKPILGICYGMQLINVALGGTLYQDIGAQIKGALDHKTGRHAVQISRSLSFIPQSSAHTVNSTHHQAVKALADGLEAFALSDDGIVEGIYKKDYNFLIGVQWHPERIFCDKLSLGIFEAFIRGAEGNGK